MAKKKSPTKKHTFKHGAPATATAPRDSSSPQTAVAPLETSTKSKAASPMARSLAGAVTMRDFSYVARDLRRLVALASSLLVLEVGLWLFLEFTKAGQAVYNLIKL